MLHRLTTMLAGVLFLASSSAFAAGQEPLTEDQARRFAATLPALDAFGDALEAEGKTHRLQIDTKPKAGEAFKPYSKAVQSLKRNYPADHAKLERMVNPHGFSASQWGRLGDRIIIAYLALTMAEQDPRAMAMMEGMDKSALDMMPPEIKERFAAAATLMDTVKNAPEADKKVVATVKPELDAHMSDE